MNEPDIQLHCPSELCGGMRVFGCDSDTRFVNKNNWTTVFVTYKCRNCQRQTKVYALILKSDDAKPESGLAQKLGEVPAFGPPVPARVITLIGPDRELFLRGRRAENHGLGIGAFAYYRRVVENQKGRIITEMGRVAQRIGGSKEALELFARAAKETRFSQAIELVKSAIPQSLLIDGNNPLSLLHSALSEGLHEGPEGECLQLATSIRLVLIESCGANFSSAERRCRIEGRSEATPEPERRERKLETELTKTSGST